MARGRSARSVFVGIARIIGVDGFVREVVRIDLRDPGREPSLRVGTRTAAFPGRVANHIVCAAVTFDTKHAVGRNAQAVFADKELGVFDRHLREQVAGVFRKAAVGPRLFGERQEVEPTFVVVMLPWHLRGGGCSAQGIVGHDGTHCE